MTTSLPHGIALLIRQCTCNVGIGEELDGDGDGDGDHLVDAVFQERASSGASLNASHFGEREGSSLTQKETPSCLLQLHSIHPSSSSGSFRDENVSPNRALNSSGFF